MSNETIRHLKYKIAETYKENVRLLKLFIGDKEVLLLFYNIRIIQNES